MQLQYNVLDDEDCATAVLLLVGYGVLDIHYIIIVFYFIIIVVRRLSPDGLPGHNTRPYATARPIGRSTVSYAVSTTDRRSAHRTATNLLPPTTTVTHTTHHSTVTSLPNDYMLIYIMYTNTYWKIQYVVVQRKNCRRRSCQKKMAFYCVCTVYCIVIYSTYIRKK